MDLLEDISGRIRTAGYRELELQIMVRTGNSPLRTSSADEPTSVRSQYLTALDPAKKACVLSVGTQVYARQHMWLKFMGVSRANQVNFTPSKFLIQKMLSSDRSHKSSIPCTWNCLKHVNGDVLFRSLWKCFQEDPNSFAHPWLQLQRILFGY